MGKFLIFLILALSGGASQADLYIDPLLKQQMTQNGLAGSVKAILVFKNKLQTPRGFATPLNRSEYQAHLMQNARMSQAAVIAKLRNYQLAGGATSAKSFWIANALIVNLSPVQLREILNDPNLAAAYANRPARFIKPRKSFVSSVRNLNDGFTYGLKKLRIPELRVAQPQLDGRGVRVGILDTGIDATHPDLQGKTVLYKDFTGAYDQEPHDYDGHGTHVAGTIAGGAASGTAIGVAPQARLIVGSVWPRATIESLMTAMQWVADPDSNPHTNDGARVVNNSWGFSLPRPEEDPASNVFCQAIDNWARLGILAVFAAGNLNYPSSVETPAACPNAVAVGATDESDSIAPWSARGPAVWKTKTLIKPVVSAPGVGVLSSVRKGKYEMWDGTSMAAPHVVGLAALVYQKYPSAPVDFIAKAIMRGAFDLGPVGNDNDSGWGRIDAFKTFHLDQWTWPVQ